MQIVESLPWVDWYQGECLAHYEDRGAIFTISDFHRELCPRGLAQSVKMFDDRRDRLPEGQ